MRDSHAAPHRCSPERISAQRLRKSTILDVPGRASTAYVLMDDDGAAPACSFPPNRPNPTSGTHSKVKRLTKTVTMALRGVCSHEERAVTNEPEGCARWT